MASTYLAPAWLPGAHLQTVWPLLLRSRQALPSYQRERVATPDGDFLDLDWAGTDNTAPLLVLFHGLEGSSHSHYARALMHAVVAHGWRGVVVHFRGCSGEANALPRAYHSGDSAEVAWLLAMLHQRQPHVPLFAMGVSLGGNALLKHLGEQGPAAQAYVTAAAAVSVPYDLAAANECLSRGVGRLYARHFLRTLIPRSLAKAQRFPSHPVYADTRALRAARTLRAFDDAVTAPLHGFANADAYYAHSSSGQYLQGIRVPTLLLHARNDPFLPVEALPRASQLPPTVRLELSPGGGHVGFVGGPVPGHLDWLPQRLIAHFMQYDSSNRVA